LSQTTSSETRPFPQSSSEIASVYTTRRDAIQPGTFPIEALFALLLLFSADGPPQLFQDLSRMFTNFAE